MNMQRDLKAQLKEKYQELFQKYVVDEQTGQLGYCPCRKFATYPYIGSRYGEAAKILIVGLDIGKDETPERPGQPGWFQSFEERRAAIEDKHLSKHNPHIAGTYFTAMFFLKDDLGWNKYWNEIKGTSTCQQALKVPESLPTPNPLSYIALTNHYKFVTGVRGGREGGGDRVYLDKNFDQKFFIEEVEFFKPDIVIFQSKAFINESKYRTVLRDLLGTERSIYVGPHPSYWVGENRRAKYFVKQINPLIL